MIGYTMVGTRDLDRSLRFYDPIFSAMGWDQCWRNAQLAAWGDKDNEAAPRFFAGYPFDGHKVSVGNGAMTAFLVADPAVIDRLFAIAIEGGGSSEGEPGLRPHYGKGFYGAYVRDPDGNKLAFVCYDAKPSG